MIDGDNLGKMRESLKVYRTKLIDLSKRNPLINLSPKRKTNIVIAEGSLESLKTDRRSNKKPSVCK